MGEPFKAVFTFKGFLSAVNPLVLLEMMFELECFAALVTLEPSKDVGFLVGNHVALKAVDVGEFFVAHRTRHTCTVQELGGVVSHGRVRGWGDSRRWGEGG